MNEVALASWRQRADLAALKGGPIVLSLDELRELIEAIEDPEIELDLLEDHHEASNNCETCDDIKKDLTDTQKELAREEKEHREALNRIIVLKEQNDDLVTRIIATK